MIRRFLIATVLLLSTAGAYSHEMRPAYLHLQQVDSNSYDVLWKVPAAGNNLRLGLDVEFSTHTLNISEPRGHIAEGSFTQRWRISCPGGLSGEQIRIARLSATRTDALVRIDFLDGGYQVARLTPAAPSFMVKASSSAIQVAATYIRLGFEHILCGVDHLLFVLGLLLIVRNKALLLKTVTAFTVAHSLTLVFATLGYVSVPTPPLEAAIALSILFLGPEIFRAERGETSLTIRYPWVVAFVFGLLHGFGFAGGLSTTGMAPMIIPQALLWFNVGVELGQLSFIGIVMALAWSFRVREVGWPLVLRRAPGYAVGISGAFWTMQRIAVMLAGG